jgi:hypothetical protein
MGYRHNAPGVIAEEYWQAIGGHYHTNHARASGERGIGLWWLIV